MSSRSSAGPGPAGTPGSAAGTAAPEALHYTLQALSPSKRRPARLLNICGLFDIEAIEPGFYQSGHPKTSLRGVLHGAMGILMLPAAAWLLISVPPHCRGPAAGYCFGCIVCYVASFTYHRVHSPGVAIEQRRRQIDKACIFVMIAGSNTPLAGSILRRPELLALLWAIAAMGIATEFPELLGSADSARQSAPYSARHHSLAPLPYIAHGSLSVVLFWLAWDAGLLRPLESAILVSTWVQYLIGAWCYATQRGTLAKGHFEPHDMFHLLVGTAGITTYFLQHLWLGRQTSLA
jgi:channel protein (hemolysin III family)